MTGRTTADKGWALITGASSGIGAAMARALAKRGQATLLLARRQEPLERLAEELRGVAASEVLSADLSKLEELQAKVLEATANKRVTVLVNNGGHGFCRPFLEHSAEDLEFLMTVHYHAPATLIRSLLPGMLEHGGHVVNVASMATKIGPWGHSGYAAAKAALVALTQSLAIEYGRADLHFSYLNPGIIETPFFEQEETAALWQRVKKWAVPVERVSRALLKVLDRPRLEMCIPRHHRALDGIKAVSPDWALSIVRGQSRPAKAALSSPPKSAGDE